MTDVDDDVVLGTMVISKVLDGEGGLAFTWEINEDEINRWEAVTILRALAMALEQSLVEDIRMAQGDWDEEDDDEYDD